MISRIVKICRFFFFVITIPRYFGVIICSPLTKPKRNSVPFTLRKTGVIVILSEAYVYARLNATDLAFSYFSYS